MYFKSALYANEVIHCSLKYGARAIVYCICVGVCICPMYVYVCMYAYVYVCLHMCVDHVLSMWKYRIF